MSASTTTYPYSTVVYITDTIGGEGWQGSGVLISPDEVLTASHVVYTQGVGTASNITVSPGYNAGAAPFGTASGTTIHYFPIDDADHEITQDQSQYDYAVIHLSQSFTSLGTMGLLSEYQGGTVTVSGYPASADGAQVDTSETVAVDPTYTVLDGTSIGEGSSGGPVWVDGSSGPQVVGVVSSGAGGEAGTFVQITNSVLDQIESWVAQDDAACFAAGTRIATSLGLRPVEALAEGEQVVTRAGEKLPIVWLGHRRVECRRHPKPAEVWPVRVRAGAFGPGRPGRDLLLSPDHAVFTGGVLIPVRYLLNAATVAQVPTDSVTYWHVELDRHSVILAEGLACESYLDTGNRAAFAGGGTVRLHPDFARGVWHARGCAPLVLAGKRLAAARARLLRRAAALGHAVTEDPALAFLCDGRALPALRQGAVWRVRLPQGGRTVTLASRVWVPAHTRADEQDTRRLGVAIARIWLDRREASLDSAALAAGWHTPEAGWRWTDGAATLLPQGVRELAVAVAMTGSYWRDAPHGAARAA